MVYIPFNRKLWSYFHDESNWTNRIIYGGLIMVVLFMFHIRCIDSLWFGTNYTNPDEKFIFMKNRVKVAIEAGGTYRLILNIEQLDRTLFFLK